MRIRAKKITKGSLFKLIFIGISIPFLPFFLLCGIASVFGGETVKWGGEPITGLMGLLAAVLMYPVFCLLFSCFAWLGGAFGLWVYSRFRQLELAFEDAEVLQ